MSYTLYLDFETYDPAFGEEAKEGFWDERFQIICMGYAIDDQEVQVTRDLDEMARLIDDALILAAHNAFYELKCVQWLIDVYGAKIDYKWKPVFDTMIASKLRNNLRKSHSLDYLAKSILKEEKDQSRLGRAAIAHSFEDGSKWIDYPKKYYSTDDEEYKTKTEKKYIDKATKWAISNLHIFDNFYSDLVDEYCNNDVKLTRELHKYFLTKLDKFLYSSWSELQKITWSMHRKGVRIDIDKASEIKEEIEKDLEELENKAKENDWYCNYNSTKELPKLFLSLGVELEQNPATGNYICTKKTLEAIDHPAAKLILEHRKLTKILTAFILPALEKSRAGRMHGTMNVIGARATGRFSHTNPNLGNQPSRDEKYGPLIRSLFIPEKDEKWYHMDFSSQEPRLYIHYAVKLHKARARYKTQEYNRAKGSFEFSKKITEFSCPAAITMQRAYHKDPLLSYHDMNVAMIKSTVGIDIQRKAVKAIGLGKAYGKGTASTAKDLQISEEECKTFMRAFDEGAPYIKMTSDLAQYYFHKNGAIKTIGGRKNRCDGVLYRAYNYLIQGSAADQTAQSLLNIYYKYDIIPLTVVHDEINISASSRDLAERVKYEMENAIPLEVPSYTEIGEGKNWADAK